MLQKNEEIVENPDELYDAYQRFMEDMTKGRDHPVPALHRIDFFAWLNGMDAARCAQLIADYRKGYAACLAEAEQSVADVMASLTPPDNT